MVQKKYCCRIFPILLLFVSVIFSAGIWYFDEGAHAFIFLKDRGEFFNFLGTSLFISLLPIGIFYRLNEKEKYQSKAKQFALLGFIPTVLFFFFFVI